MAIKGLSDQLRALREAKFKLGYVKRGKSFPSDTDVFVGKRADGITDRMIEAYGATPISDAQEAGVFSFGRELRGILKFEFDTRDKDGGEVVYESLNRAWGQSRIRCSGDGGDGGDNAGDAWVRDQRFAERLERAGLLRGKRHDGSGWGSVCKGKDCPLWHSAATDTDKVPSCHRETRFRFVLLSPVHMDPRLTLDQQDEEYIRQLGWVEIATSSWNGTVDIQSGMRTIQAEARGRTAFLPFTLKRQMRSISAPTGRVQKATLMVVYDTDEVQIFASGNNAARAQLRPAMRRQLAELEQAEAAALALAPASYGDVADIQPQPDRTAAQRPALPEPAKRPSWATTDRGQAIAETQREPSGASASDEEPPPAVTQAAPVRKLGQDGRDELKRLCGGVEDANGGFSNLDGFRARVSASYEALGVPRNPDAGDLEFIPIAEIPEVRRGSFGYLTTAHADWIRAQPAEPVVDRDPDEAVEGELLGTRIQ